LDEVDSELNGDCCLCCQSNIGLILHAVEEYELSLRFLEHALSLSMRYYGPGSLKVAMNYHLVARTHSCRGDFRAALHSEKEAFTIYKRLVSRAGIAN
jgi:protein TIF31